MAIGLLFRETPGDLMFDNSVVNVVRKTGGACRAAPHNKLLQDGQVAVCGRPGLRREDGLSAIAS